MLLVVNVLRFFVKFEPEMFLLLFLYVVLLNCNYWGVYVIGSVLTRCYFCVESVKPDWQLKNNLITKRYI